MKANDTVMPLEYSALDSLNCAGISDKKILRVLEAQAEISFKAGIKEVVEWIRRNIPDDCGEFIGSEIWQSKLKEWGVLEE